MFKNINNLLILIAGLIVCYIFYNVFILENFNISTREKIINFKKEQATALDDFIKKNTKNCTETLTINRYMNRSEYIKKCSILSDFKRSQERDLKEFKKNNRPSKKASVIIN